jgi:nucleotide-binding universal stress UspA family protein
MIPITNRHWATPATILFATELPANEHVFAFALAQARSSQARLILFHAYDTLVVSASETSGVRYYDFAAAASSEMKYLEPLAEQARAVGIECEIVVRQGLAARLILECSREKNADRIVLGTHSPGPISKIVIGSIAEEVLRSSEIPVCTIGPDVIDQAFQGYRAKTVLCATALHESAHAEAALAAEIAERDGARLIMLHVLRPHDSVEILTHRTLEQIEDDLNSLVPGNSTGKLRVESLVVPGDPTEEILFQAKSQRADLLVLGAQSASLFATLTRHGVVYRVLAHAPCPVLTLSPLALQRVNERIEQPAPAMRLAHPV